MVVLRAHTQSAQGRLFGQGSLLPQAQLDYPPPPKPPPKPAVRRPPPRRSSSNLNSHSATQPSSFRGGWAEGVPWNSLKTCPKVPSSRIPLCSLLPPLAPFFSRVCPFFAPFGQGPCATSSVERVVHWCPKIRDSAYHTLSCSCQVCLCACANVCGPPFGSSGLFFLFFPANCANCATTLVDPLGAALPKGVGHRIFFWADFRVTN